MPSQWSSVATSIPATPKVPRLVAVFDPQNIELEQDSRDQQNYGIGFWYF